MHTMREELPNQRETFLALLPASHGRAHILSNAMPGKRLILLPEIMPPGLLGSWYLSPGPTGMGRMLGWIGMVTLWHLGKQLGSRRMHTLSLIEPLPLQSMCVLLGTGAPAHLAQHGRANCASLLYCLSECAELLHNVVCMHRDSLLHVTPISALQDW